MYRTDGDRLQYTPAMPLLLYFALQGDPLQGEIDRILTLSEEGKHEEAETRLRKLIPPRNPDKTLQGVRIYLRIRKVADTPPSPEKVLQLRDALAQIDALPPSGRELEFRAVGLEALGRAQLALGRTADASLSFATARGLYADLLRRTDLGPVRCRLLAGFSYNTGRVISLCKPDELDLRLLTRDLDRLADEVCFLYPSSPTLLDSLLHVSGAFLEIASCGGDESFTDYAWRRSLAWSDRAFRLWKEGERTGMSTLPLLRVAQQEVLAALGYYEWRKGLQKDTSGILDRAATLVTRAVEADPTSPRWQILRARLCAHRGDPAGALDAALRAFRSDDTVVRRQAAEFLLHLGTASPQDLADAGALLLGAGETALAADAFRKALESNPAPGPAAACRLRLGEALFALNRPAEAAEALAPLQTDDAAVFPETRPAIQLRLRLLRLLASSKPGPDLAQSVEAARRFLDAHGWLEPMDLREAAVAHESRGEFAEASAQWRRLAAFEDPPLRQEALSRIGFCSLRLAETASGEERAARVREAREAFQTHFQEYKKNAGHPGDLAASAYHLASLSESPSDAARILFDAASLVPRAYASELLLRALSHAARSPEIDLAFDIHRRMEAVSGGREFDEPASRSLLILGYACERHADSMRESGDRGWGEYAVQALQLYWRAFQLRRLSHDEARQVAQRAFLRARSLDTAEIYGWARRIQEDLLEYDPEASASEVLRNRLQWRIGYCRLKEHDYPGAIRILEALEPAFPEDPEFLEALGDSYAGDARRLQGEKRVERWKEALRRYDQVVRAGLHALRFGDESWVERLCRNCHKGLEILLVMDPRQATERVKVLEPKGFPDWDADRFGYRSRFMDQLRDLERKDPLFRRSPPRSPPLERGRPDSLPPKGSPE